MTYKQVINKTLSEYQMNQILSNFTASISELKKNPTALLKSSEGEPVAILNHNSPTAYLIPAQTYEWLMERLDDIELTQLIEERRVEKDQAIEVKLDEL